MPQILTLILPWVVKNWFIPIALIVGLGLYIYGWTNGADSIRGQWDKSIIEQQEAINKKISDYRKLDAIKAKEFEQTKTVLETQNKDIQRRLKNEIAKNTPNAQCVLSSDFLQIYNDTVLDRERPSTR